jgi:polyhydroxyalkanoate synthesis regulator protein
LKVPSVMPIGETNQPLLVKRYARRRRYRPDSMTYLTRGEFMAIARRGERSAVAETGCGQDDIAAFYRISGNTPSRASYE